MFCLTAAQAKALGSPDMTTIQEGQVETPDYINRLLKIYDPTKPWLLASVQNTPPETGLIPLGRHRGYYLWLTPEGKNNRSLSTFVEFVLAQISPLPTSSKSTDTQSKQPSGGPPQHQLPWPLTTHVGFCPANALRTVRRRQPQ